MLARVGGTATKSSSALRTVVLLGLIVAMLSFPSGAAGSAYVVVTHPNATRTVAYNLSDPSGFTLQNVTAGNGTARLSWQPQALNWSGPDFSTNQSAAMNVNAGADGLALAANLTNRIPEGNFTSMGPWSYVDDSAQTVTARWEESGDALLGHRSNSTQVLFDALDSDPSANWSQVSSGACGIILSNVTGGQRQGTGMVRANISVGGPCAETGMQRKNPLALNWSGYDRLLIWVNLTSAVAMMFNLSAVAGMRTYWTASQTLTGGWQEIVVNLTQLGTQRDALSQVTLNFLPASSGTSVVYLDDIRTATNVAFNATALVGQSFSKPDLTSSSPGTALFSFDWEVAGSTGAEFTDAVVTLYGPTQALRYHLPSAAPGSWSHPSFDVSAVVAPVGDYIVSLNLTVAADTTYAIDARVRIDNVSLLLADRQNGTYASRVLDLGIANVLGNATLGLVLPMGTSAEVRFRGSLSLNPVVSGWDFTLSWNRSGVYPLGARSVRTVQVLVALNTTNASESPVLVAFELLGEHYATRGTLTTRPFTAEAAFVYWRQFDAFAEDVGAPAATNVVYSVDDGAGWVPVEPGANLTSLTGRTISVRVELDSSLGYYSPRLHSVNLTYDFLGPLVRVGLSPRNESVVSGRTLQFTAVALDSGGHVNRSVYFLWNTNDPGGTVDTAGLFHAGEPGTYNVTAMAFVPGTGFSATVNVTVLPATGPPANSLLLLLLGGVAAVAAAGYLIFEVLVRRRFIMDDLFLISRDGRLICHNTRRLLPDRDEDILSGMLTAINSFVRDSWKEENGNVRRFDFGGKTVLVERGEHVFLAAVYASGVPGWAARGIKGFLEDLESHFGQAFAHWDGSPEDLQHLNIVVARAVSHMRYNRRRVWKGLAS